MKLNAPDMTCSHCAGVITKAVKSVDAGAVVTVDHAAKTVKVETTASQVKVSRAIGEAGYANIIQ